MKTSISGVVFGGMTASRSASVHLRSGGVTRVVTITMMTTAE